MVRRPFVALFFLLFYFVPATKAEILSIAVAGDTELTRITIETDVRTDADIFLIFENATPIIDFVPTHSDIADTAFLGEPTGAIEAYTIDPDKVSFELRSPMMIMRELAPPPEVGDASRRYIIDLTAVSEARFMRAAERDTKRRERQRSDVISIVAEPVTPKPATAPSLKPWGLDTFVEIIETSRKVIVIDPGHGGRDPGTSSILGGQEKKIVLEASKRLKALLEEDARYEVYLTRETDVYVEHEDRVSKARDWGADLFISIHVDASGSLGTDGASVYSIDSRGERRKETAARQNGWHMQTGAVDSGTVETILEDLIKRETKSNSAIFAEMVLPELSQAGPLLENPFRRNNLAVLLAPDVPAVLIELGFITNRADAKRLKSRGGQDKAAKAIKRAIDAYFDRQDLILAPN